MNPTVPPPSVPPPARTHRIRAAAGLIIMALALGVALAAVLGAVVWAIALALHSAASA